MKKEQEQYGMHPMIDAEIEAFFSGNTKPLKGVFIPSENKNEPRFTIPQFIQMLAKANGYKVYLTKM